MSDIFLSYSHEDLSRVTPLVSILEQRGWSVFWDTTIPAGMTWRDFINEHLTEARCIVVVWSKNSVKSTWVREEAGEGQQRHILVPVRIDPVDPPRGFKEIEVADLTDWTGESGSPALKPLFDGLSARLGSLPTGSSTEHPAGPVAKPAEPSPTSSVKPIDAPLPSRSFQLAWPKQETWQKIGGFAFAVGIAIMVLRGVLFDPRIEVMAKDVDWEPRSPKAGQEVTFTGKFLTTYHVRQGYQWERAEIRRQWADTYTSTWSVNGVNKDIEDTRTVNTGEVVEATFKQAFEKPGQYQIRFAVRSARTQSDAVPPVVRTIFVQAP